MTPIFPNLPAQLGVYTLVRRLGSHSTMERYIAKQSHVERAVVVEVMRPDMPQPVLDAFLRNARARVVENVPHVSQVLESMTNKGTWYTTLECPEGTPLSRLREQGKCLTTQQACLVLEQVAQIYDYCAGKDIAAGGLTDDAIFIKGKTEIAVLSPIIAGKHQDTLRPSQLDALAAAMRPVRPVGMPGETRIKTLLEWLEQDFENGRLDWQTIADTAKSVREQVAPIISRKNVADPAANSISSRVRNTLQPKAGWKRYALPGGIALGAVLLMTAAGFFIGPMLDGGEIPPIHGGYVYCTRADGGTVAIMENPVSIGEYGQFINFYNSAPMEQRSLIDAGIPGTEFGHTPADWDAQWNAAVGGKKWQGKRLTPDSPVTGVSYWDAVAYANYVHGQLPEQHSLRSARTASGQNGHTEWTASSYSGGNLYAESRILLPAGAADTPILETDPASRKEGRAFRLAFPGNPPARKP